MRTCSSDCIALSCDLLCLSCPWLFGLCSGLLHRVDYSLVELFSNVRCAAELGMPFVAMGPAACVPEFSGVDGIDRRLTRC